MWEVIGGIWRHWFKTLQAANQLTTVLVVLLARLDVLSVRRCQIIDAKDGGKIKACNGQVARRRPRDAQEIAHVKEIKESHAELVEALTGFKAEQRKTTAAVNKIPDAAAAAAAKVVEEKSEEKKSAQPGLEGL